MGHPVLDHDLGFQTVAEPVDRQALIAELPIEALCGAVLPGLARVDQGRLDFVLGSPLEQRRGYELGIVVAAQVGRRPANTDDSGQHFNHPGRSDRSPDIDGQRLLRELVVQLEALELPPVGSGVEDEVRRMRRG